MDPEKIDMTIDGKPVAAPADIKFEPEDPVEDREDAGSESKFKESDQNQEEERDEGEEKPKEDEWRPQFDDREQDFVNKLMADQHGRLAKRYEPMQQELEQLRAQVSQMQPQSQGQQDPGRPVIPPIPEWDDDQYDAKMEKVLAATREQAIWDASAEARQAYEQHQQQAQQKAYVEELTKDVQSYSNKAKKAGISEAELKMAGANVIPEIHPDITRRLFKHDAGGQIMKYLNNNPAELEKLKGMDNVDGWLYIQSELKGKATNKPIPKTPAPTERVEGGGYPGDPFGAKAAGMVIK